MDAVAGGGRNRWSRQRLKRLDLIIYIILYADDAVLMSEGIVLMVDDILFLGVDTVHG